MGILIGSGEANPPTEKQQQGYAAAKARYSKSVAGTLADAEPNYAPYPNQDAPDCYYAKGHDSADLCAQWRAAVAAEKAAKWTKAGFWLSLLGTLLSGVGLACLLLSLRQTERSLKSARKANRLAKRVSDAEMRPYLFVENVEFVDVKRTEAEEEEDNDPDETGLPMFSARVVFKLRNFGKLPARNIRVWDKVYFGKMHQGKFWGMRFSKVDIGVCAPDHQRRVFAYIYLIGDDVSGFFGGIVDVFARIRFTYENDYGLTYTEKAQYRANGSDLDTFYLLAPVDVASVRKNWTQYEMKYNAKTEE